MHAVDIAYASRRDLCDHVVASDDRLALVIPDPSGTVHAGAPVSVRVRANGLAGDAMFEGLAHEVRVGSQSVLAVVPESTEQPRLSFLRDWARGTTSGAYRREERLSTAHIPAVITLATPAVRRETVQVLDVSDRGARITFPEPLARGSLLILELSTPDGLVSFAASVMWAAHATVGLQLCHSFASERAAWAKLVSDVRRTFGDRVAASTAADEAEVFMFSAADSVSFEAASDDDSPASTGAYRIVDRRAVEKRHDRPSLMAANGESHANVVPSDEPVAEDLNDFVVGKFGAK